METQEENTEVSNEAVVEEKNKVMEEKKPELNPELLHTGSNKSEDSDPDLIVVKWKAKAILKEIRHPNFLKHIYPKKWRQDYQIEFHIFNT